MLLLNLAIIVIIVLLIMIMILFLLYVVEIIAVFVGADIKLRKQIVLHANVVVLRMPFGCQSFGCGHLFLFLHFALLTWRLLTGRSFCPLGRC